VALAAGQVPDQEGIDRAERQLAGLGLGPRAVDRIQDPGELGAGEIGVEQQAGLLGDHRLVALGLEAGAQLGGAAVLPDDGAVNRLAGLAVPNDHGLALVGDADGGDVAGRQAGIRQRDPHRVLGGAPQIAGRVLDPAGAGEVLFELLLSDALDGELPVEDDGAGRGRPLVDGEHVAGHAVSPVSW